MTNPVHLLSVAALLLVAFLVGAAIGSLARVIALRQQRKPAAAAALAEATVLTAPLVAAPVIARLPVAATPVVPEAADIPVPDFAATLIALADEKPPADFLAAAVPNAVPASAAPMAEPARPVPVIASAAPQMVPMQPAHVAGETTSGIHVAAPRHDVPSVPIDAAAAMPEQRTAEVIPFPSSPAEPPANRLSDIIVGGETVAIVDASDLAPEATDSAVAAPIAGDDHQPDQSRDANADKFVFVHPDEPREAAPTATAGPTSDTIPIPAFSASAPVGAVLAAALPIPEVVQSAPVVEAEPVAVEPPAQVPEAAPEPVDVEEPIEAVATEPDMPPEPATPPEPQPPELVVAPTEPLDEDAAMRAIEGSWTPRRKPPRPVVRAVEAPEGANQAVAASARAVTAARRTAEAVVAEAKVEAGRPAGLDGPRDGRKDDLTHIIGVLPVIETALNKLGIYHFDQVGALSDENIGWIEGHLGVPGRIARELWREQARELSAVLRPKRAAEK